MLDEPFCLSIENVANLTMRQITLLYYRERDNKGIPRPIQQSYDYDSEGNRIDTTRDDFYNLGAALGMTQEELDRRWAEQEANKNG